MENELKLLITQEQVDQLIQHPCIKKYAKGRSQTKHLISTYYDTQTHQLSKSGMVLRIRETGDGFIQTIKSSGDGVVGLHQRQEWESDVETNELDFSKLPEEVKDSLLASEEFQQQLQPIFKTDFTRDYHNLHFSDGTHIELAVDLGQVTTGEKQCSLSEVELELVNGELSKVFELALDLTQDIPLVLENISKAERGYGLHHPVKITSQRPRPLGVKAEEPLTSCFPTLVFNCIQYWQENEKAFKFHVDSDVIKHLYLAPRHLRMALRLLLGIVPRFVSAPIRRQEQWLEQEVQPLLSAFLLHQTLVKHKENDPECHLAYQQSIAQFSAVLQSQHYTRMNLQLGAWMITNQWHKSLDRKAVNDLRTPVGEKIRQLYLKQVRSVQELKGRHKDMHVAAWRDQWDLLENLRIFAGWYGELSPEHMPESLITLICQIQMAVRQLHYSHLLQQEVTQQELTDTQCKIIADTVKDNEEKQFLVIKENFQRLLSALK